MRRDADIVIVGAGIAGVAAARAAAQSGRSVLLLDQFEPGHTAGSSHGTSRIFRLNYDDERFVRMAQTSLELWRELERESGQEIVTQTGVLDLGAMSTRNARALAACGVVAEELHGAEITRRFGIVVANDELALFQADGGHIRADRAHAAHLEAAAAAGCEARWNTKVDELVPERNGVKLATSAGEVTATVVIVTAGAWADRLLATAGVELSVVPTRETVAYVSLPQAEEIPPVIDYGGLPAAGEGGLRRTGQAAYALGAPGVGLKVGLHHSGAVSDPDDRSAEPEAAVAAWAAGWAARRYPNAGDLLRAETCLYTSTADERFVLQRHGRIVVGSACSGHGFKFATLVGRTLAALASEVPRGAIGTR